MAPRERERGRPVEWLTSVEQHFGHRPLAHGSEPSSPKASAAHGRLAIWHSRDDTPVAQLPAGKALAIESRVPFALHLGLDGWHRIEDRVAAAGAFGICSIVLTEEELAEAEELNFARKYASSWENRDHRVALEKTAACVPKLPREALTTMA